MLIEQPVDRVRPFTPDRRVGACFALADLADVRSRCRTLIICRLCSYTIGGADPACRESRESAS
jgi:hypothetical protein